MTLPESPLVVAFDGGPLLSARTGIGHAVAMMQAHLNHCSDLHLRTYACSFRGTLSADMTRLPLPAAAAHRMWSRVNWPRLDRWLRPAQVVHGTNYVVPPSRLPRVVSVYDCWFLRNPQQANPAVALAGAVLRQSVRHGAHVHACSEATAQQVRLLLHTDAVTVVPLAALPLDHLDPAHIVPPRPDLAAQDFIVSIGTQERRKNLPTLIAAFGAAASALGQVRLVLAGREADDSANIAAAIGALPADIQSRVVQTGQIADGHKRWLLSNALGLAYPSLDEGFGFPLLEAMQHRLPIVASDAGSIPEVGGPAALMVDAADFEGLAEALVRLVHDDAERSRLVSAGQQQLHTFSWQHTAQSLNGLYHRLAQEGSSR